MSSCDCKPWLYVILGSLISGGLAFCWFMIWVRRAQMTLNDLRGLLEDAIDANIAHARSEEEVVAWEKLRWQHGRRP